MSIRWIGILACTALVSAQKEAAPYESDKILRVDIRLDAKDWLKLRTSHRVAELKEITKSPFVYYKADAVIDGKEMASVGVRKKGFFGSVVSTRPSLKVRFDKFVKKRRFHGLDQLTLNNNVQDPSQIHQYMAYWYFRRAGVPAPRCSFAVVSVNGEKLGVYSNVESIRKPFLKRAFGSSKGDLYEGYAGDFDAKTLDNVVHKGKDPMAARAPLEALRDLLKKPKVTAAAIAQHVDLDAFFKYWVAEVLIGHWDSYSGNRNNYYVFRPKKSPRFHFIPWGADNIVQDPGPFITQKVPKSVKAVGILCKRLWEIPEMRERYREEMRRQLRDVFVEKEIVAETRRLRDLIEPHLTVFERQIANKITAVQTFFLSRRKAVEAELGEKDLKWPRVNLDNDIPANPTMMTVTGTFATKLGTGMFGGIGKGTLKVQVDGEKELSFKNVISQALPEDPMFIRPGHPVVRVMGNHVKTGKRWYVSFYIDPIRMEIERPKLEVDHFGVWSIIVAGNPFGKDAEPRIFGVTGTLTVDEISTKVGGRAVGKFRVKSIAIR